MDTTCQYGAHRFSNFRPGSEEGNYKLHIYHLMTHRLQQLDKHTGFFVLKNALPLLRLLFLLRSSPCYRHSDDLAPYDECTRNTSVLICNVQFDDTVWKQARLPVSFGGLCFRSADDLFIQAYLSSRESCRRLASTMLPLPSDTSFENAGDIFSTCTSSRLKIPVDSVRQSNLDSQLCFAQVAALKPILSQRRLAFFVAATCTVSVYVLSIEHNPLRDSGQSRANGTES